MRPLLTMAMLVSVASAGALWMSCSSTLKVFSCTDRGDCRTEEGEGVCEETGFCSFSDESCVSGRRYGKLSGDSSNQCVLPGPSDPATPDASTPDAALIDAAPALPDASTPDADMTITPDAGLMCPNPPGAIECPIDMCPGSADLCCVYGIVDGNDSCNDLCKDLGMNCAAAAKYEAGCEAMDATSCNNNVDEVMCYCQ